MGNFKTPRFLHLIPAMIFISSLLIVIKLINVFKNTTDYDHIRISISVPANFDKKNADGNSLTL
jgi:hypothetical protein